MLVSADGMRDAEISEMDRNILKRFYDCMEQFRTVSVQSPAYQAAEEQLSNFLYGLRLPEDMSQIVHCLKSEPEGSRTKLSRSVLCLRALSSWTEVSSRPQHVSMCD